MSGRALVAHATDLLAQGFLTEATDRTADGSEPTNALFAVTGALGRALAFKQPALAVAVVAAAPDMEAWPPLLQTQNQRLVELFEAHGLAVVRADDPAHIVASYTETALAAGYDVVVLGSDKRLAQLVGDRVWWYDAYKDVRYTPALVRKRFEVGREHVAEWLALVGDDGILPGIKGIGKKGATTLIETYGSVASAIAHSDAIKGRTGNALRASLATVEQELARARLHRDRPLPVPLSDLAYRPPAHDKVQELYRQLGFFELLSADGNDQVEVEVCDTPERVQQTLATFDERPVSLIALTEDPSPVRGSLAGLALAQDPRIVYVPLAGKGNSLAAVPPALAGFLSDAARTVVGHDTKAAIVALARHGVPVAGVIGDSACASHLAEPSNWAPHDLSLVARHVLRRALPEDDAVRGVGKRRKPWSAVPIDRAAAHAGQLAAAAENAWAALEPTTPPALLEEYLALSETLVRMEERGIACDGADLARAGEDFARIVAELEGEIYQIAGKTFNVGSTKQLGHVLFADLGLPVLKRTKTGWSTATEALERIEHAHPIVALVIRWRRLRRLMDSWVTALCASIDDDGRVRSTFHPARSFSGRIINSNPDLGRVPGRTPEMARIRHAFRAPPGTVLLSVDYNQLGVYVLAHLTGDPALIEPLSTGQDLHTLTAAAVLERQPDDIGDSERQLGKIVNFATFAGQGASALALQLGVSAREARQLIERFDRRYAGVRAFQDQQLGLARERGYIQTLAGRRWPIGSLSSLDPEIRSYAERMARRASHEGSVADVSRRGLLRADRALRAAGLATAPLLQVHDEVLFEVPEGELAAAVEITATAMRRAFDLKVPLRVGCKAGPNWADLEPLPAAG
ncbi:MAG: DNA polymerase [Proteobacteria bacterium]|nr:DNA polymerase [Pseudomonadota bacterium]